MQIRPTRLVLRPARQNILQQTNRPVEDSCVWSSSYIEARVWKLPAYKPQIRITLACLPKNSPKQYSLLSSQNALLKWRSACPRHAVTAPYAESRDTKGYVSRLHNKVSSQRLNNFTISLMSFCGQRQTSVRLLVVLHNFIFTSIHSSVTVQNYILMPFKSGTEQI